MKNKERVKLAIYIEDGKEFIYYDSKIKETEIYFNLITLIKMCEKSTDYSIQDIFEKIKLAENKFGHMFSNKKVRKKGNPLFYDDNMCFYPNRDVKCMIANERVYINCEENKLLAYTIIFYLVLKQIHRKLIRKSKNKEFDSVVREAVSMVEL